MRHYTDFARRRGVELEGVGACQLCGAPVQGGVHECMEIFALGFGGLGLSEPSEHIFRFLLVDAHALQHPELHGQWSNHFHLSRLELVLTHRSRWEYAMSPKLSDALGELKGELGDVMRWPERGARGEITSAHVNRVAHDRRACKELILTWAEGVHRAWSHELSTIAPVVEAFRRDHHARTWTDREQLLA